VVFLLCGVIRVGADGEAGAIAESDAVGLADIARHIIQRTLIPRLLYSVAPYEEASNIRQAQTANNLTSDRARAPPAVV